MENLNLLLRRLLENKVDFVLIGGYAAVIHGASQVTHDLDICAVMTANEIAKLKIALSGLTPRHRMNPNFQPLLDDYPKPGDSVDNFYLQTDAGVLDILKDAKPAGSFAEIKKNAAKVRLFGFECSVISLNDLIAIKKTMTRPKDKAVLDELIEVKRKLR